MNAVSTLHKVFSSMDTDAFESVLGEWIESRLGQGEDGSQARTDSAPQVMAAVRNLVVSILRMCGEKNIAAAIRKIGWKPSGALELLGLIT